MTTTPPRFVLGGIQQQDGSLRYHPALATPEAAPGATCSSVSTTYAPAPLPTEPLALPLALPFAGSAHHTVSRDFAPWPTKGTLHDAES